MAEEAKNHNYFYTIILEYKNKIYLLQRNAKDQTDALHKWAELFNNGSVYISLQDRVDFIAKIKDDIEVLLLEGAIAVWASSIDISDDYCFMNTVKTASTMKKNNSLYTFIFNFLGGTYISQYKDNDINIAKHQWAKDFDCSMIKVSEDKKPAFIDTTSKSQLSPMENLQSVWHMRPKIADKYGELHVIATAR